MFNIEKILEYQSVDNEIGKIEAELEKCEYAMKAREAQNMFKEAKEQAQALEKTAETYVVYFNKARQFYEEHSKKIAELSEKLKSESDNADFEKLKNAISALSDKLGKVDKDLSDISKKTEEINQSFHAANKKGAQAKRDFNENKAAFEKERALKAPELDTLRKRRAALEANLDPQIKEKYQALKKDRMFLPFVALENPNKCSGCRMDIALDKLSILKENGYVTCESCGRVIYKK